VHISFRKAIPFVNFLSNRRDCDEFTRRFYADAAEGVTGVSAQPIEAIPFQEEHPASPAEECYPPYNGFGTVEDSLGSCKHLVLKPPKKDFIKMLENENKILRFVARMVSY
jgi:hypothetical protein